MKPITRALHARIAGDPARPTATPIYQTSGFLAGSPYFYTRKNNPNVAELEEALAALEEAPHALAVTTGMTALFLTLDLLRPGDRVVLNQDIYGCTFRLAERVSRQHDLVLDVRDLSAAAGCTALPADARMVLFETPTNPFLKTVPIRRVADAVRRDCPEALVVVDNTWATPLFQHPLEHGADLVVYSATKYFSGHSDVMGGALLTGDAELHARLADARFYGGAILDPHSAWLLRRSLQTLPLRMREHERVTRRLRAFLEARPQVARVYSPEVDGVQLRGYGGILFVELREDLSGRYAEFAAGLRLFDTGTGMACVTSMVAQPYSGSHASMTPGEKDAIGLGPGLVRLCFGFEDPDDLERDLDAALAALETQPGPARVTDGV